MRARKQDQRVESAEQSGPAGPKRAAPAHAAALLTVTGDQAKIEGNFKIADSLHIECEIGGELDIGGKMVIGERGVVHANVRTVDALVMGTYEGNLVATGDVEIAATGRVVGNLSTDSLVIEKGGFFNGTVAKLDGTDEQHPAAAAGNGVAAREVAGTRAVHANGGAAVNGSANGAADAKSDRTADKATKGAHQPRPETQPEKAAFLAEAPEAGASRD